MDYYGDINHWFSSVPPNFERVKSLSYDMQIAEQIKGLVDFHEASFKHINEMNRLRVGYETLCNNPMQVVKTVQEKLKKLSDYSTEIVNEIDKGFVISKPVLENKKRLYK